MKPGFDWSTQRLAPHMLRKKHLPTSVLARQALVQENVRAGQTNFRAKGGLRLSFVSGCSASTDPVPVSVSGRPVALWWLPFCCTDLYMPLAAALNPNPEVPGATGHNWQAARAFGLPHLHDALLELWAPDPGRGSVI